MPKNNDTVTKLSKLMGWDKVTVQGALSALISAGEEEAADILDNFLGDNAQARKVALDYLERNNKQHKPQPQSSVNNTSTLPSQFNQASEATSSQTIQQPPNNLAAEQPQQTTDTLEDVAEKPTRTAKRQNERQNQSHAPNSAQQFSQSDTLFERNTHAPEIGSAGPNVRFGTAAARKKKSSKRYGVKEQQVEQQEQLKPRECLQRLAKDAYNCLECGRILLAAEHQNQELLQVIEQGGVCKFCGGVIHRLASELMGMGAYAVHASQDSQASSADDGGGLEQALEFKNRLVGYDRDSERRTRVIDDQEEFYDLGNAWLSEAERVVLHERQEAARERELERKSKVRVTVDLVGRQVWEVVGETELSFQLTADASDDESSTSSTEGKHEHQRQAKNQDKDSTLLKEIRSLGHGNMNVFQATPPSERQSLQVEPSLVARQIVPMFIGTKSSSAVQDSSASSAPVSQSKTTRIQGPSNYDYLLGLGGSTQDCQDTKGPTFDICPPLVGSGRRQLANLSQNYKDSDNEQIQQRLLQFLQIAQQPFEWTNAPPKLVSPSELPEGCVLLKRWLSANKQAQIVQLVRDFGIADGGFYKPSYKTGSTLKMWQFCFGRHWEPRTASYQAVRYEHDKATPPNLPDSFKRLVKQAIQECQKEDNGAGIPNMAPDVCLVNFYESKGSLGLHQDKDEASKTLQQGLPVVSISIGDSADFVIANNRQGDDAQIVRLESGDLLVFGGRARNIYHGVMSIIPNSAPKALKRDQGLRPGRLNLTFRQSA